MIFVLEVSKSTVSTLLPFFSNTAYDEAKKKNHNSEKASDISKPFLSLKDNPLGLLLMQSMKGLSLSEKFLLHVCKKMACAAAFFLEKRW